MGEERARLHEHLTSAERLADEDEIRIQRQNQLIAALAAAGADTTSAEMGLQILEQIHENHLDHIELLLGALDEP